MDQLSRLNKLSNYLFFLNNKLYLCDINYKNYGYDNEDELEKDLIYLINTRFIDFKVYYDRNSKIQLNSVIKLKKKLKKILKDNKGYKVKLDEFFNSNADEEIKKEIKQHATRHIKKIYSKRTPLYYIINGFIQFSRERDDLSLDCQKRYLSIIGYNMLKKEIKRRERIQIFNQNYEN